MHSLRIGVRARLSLYARMAVALAILATFSAVVSVVLVLVGGAIGLMAVGLVMTPAEFLASAPRLAPLVPVPPVGVALVALGGVVATGLGLLAVPRYAGTRAVLTRHPLTLAGLALLAGWLYLLVVETSAVVVAALSTGAGLGTVVVVVAALSVLGMVQAVRSELSDLRDAFVEASVPASETNPELVSVVGRLAQQADVPAPDVYVTGSDRPESFTVGSGASAAVVVSSGLLDALSDEETEAVLAHEVSHLANGDSRILGAALVPVLVADDFVDADPDDPGDYIVNALFGLLRLYGQLGVAVLARGREWSSDAGAAALTGAPAALASALATLDDERAIPEEDLRDWEQSAAAMDILPAAGTDAATGPFRTHPPTEDRIERLAELAAEFEGGD